MTLSLKNLPIRSRLMLMILLTWVGYRLFYKPNKFFKLLGQPVIAGEQKFAQAISQTQDSEGNTLLTFLQELGSFEATPM